MRAFCAYILNILHMHIKNFIKMKNQNNNIKMHLILLQHLISGRRFALQKSQGITNLGKIK